MENLVLTVVLLGIIIISNLVSYYMGSKYGEQTNSLKLLRAENKIESLEDQLRNEEQHLTPDGKYFTTRHWEEEKDK